MAASFAPFRSRSPFSTSVVHWIIEPTTDYYCAVVRWRYASMAADVTGTLVWVLGKVVGYVLVYVWHESIRKHEICY